MKLTWFGRATFRIQVGGQIVVVDANASPDGIASNELTSGSDRQVLLDEALPLADGMAWKRRPAERLLDAGDRQRPVVIWSVGPQALLLDGDDERPLLLLASDVPQLGRWAQDAVVVLVGANLCQAAQQVLDMVSPKLLALAVDGGEVETTFAALKPRLDGTGLIALEPGLAVEA